MYKSIYSKFLFAKESIFVVFLSGLLYLIQMNILIHKSHSLFGLVKDFIFNSNFLRDVPFGKTSTSILRKSFKVCPIKNGISY